VNRSSALLTVARAEALFVSDLSAGTRPSRQEATAAIGRAVRAHGGVRGCAADMARWYGEHPETAVPRMRWARQTVETLYGGDGPAPRPPDDGSAALTLSRSWTLGPRHRLVTAA
jgi:hypothetical protein